MDDDNSLVLLRRADDTTDILVTSGLLLRLDEVTMSDVKSTSTLLERNAVDMNIGITVEYIIGSESMATACSCSCFYKFCVWICRKKNKEKEKTSGEKTFCC